MDPATEVTETVECGTCGKHYPAIIKETNQGDDCASFVYADTIRGCYGSALIDTEEWEFVGKRPQHVKDGVICDPCVAELQTSGAIKLRATGVW